MKLSIPLLLSLALHAVLVAGWQLDALKITKNPETVEIRIATQVREEVQELPAPPPPKPAKPKASTPRTAKPPREVIPVPAPEVLAAPSAKTPALLEAPPPPSPEEWQLASPTSSRTASAIATIGGSWFAA